MPQANNSFLDSQAYLKWEECQKEKHEYMAGQVFAMVGARREHVIVCLNIASALKQRLRNTACSAYIADMKLQVKAFDAFFYPDVMVSCHPQDRTAEQYLSHPTLIVEVLSQTTEAFDRGGKFAAYRSLLSLQESVMVDIDARRVECYRRREQNEWLLHEYNGDDDCEMVSLELMISLTEIFEDLEK